MNSFVNGGMLLSFLILWLIFLIFIRIVHRYLRDNASKNTWKKDIMVSFIQCIVVLFIFVAVQQYF